MSTGTKQSKQPHPDSIENGMALNNNNGVVTKNNNFTVTRVRENDKGRKGDRDNTIAIVNNGYVQ